MKRLCIIIAAMAAVLGLNSCQRNVIEENIIASKQLNFYVDLDESTRILFENGLYAWQGNGEEMLGVYIASTLPTVNAEAVVALRMVEASALLLQRILLRAIRCSSTSRTAEQMMLRVSHL